MATSYSLYQELTTQQLDILAGGQLEWRAGEVPEEVADLSRQLAADVLARIDFNRQLAAEAAEESASGATASASTSSVRAGPSGLPSAQPVVGVILE
jgi:hypothetical protein